MRLFAGPVVLLAIVAVGCAHPAAPVPVAAVAPLVATGTPPGVPACPVGTRFVGITGRSSHERITPGLILVPFGMPPAYVVCKPTT